MTCVTGMPPDGIPVPVFRHFPAPPACDVMQISLRLRHRDPYSDLDCWLTAESLWSGLGPLAGEVSENSASGQRESDDGYSVPTGE
jgi:hypothetical protein